MIGLAKALSAAGDHNAALGTFRLAYQVARTVKSQHLRRLAEMRTAVARGRIGDKAEAKATLRESFAVAQESNGRNNGILYERLRWVLDAQREIGDVAGANADIAGQARNSIAAGQARDGDGRGRIATGSGAARFGRQANNELGTRARSLAAGCDAAAVHLDQGLHQGQPQAQPDRTILPGLGSVPERVEHPRQQVGGDPPAVVPNPGPQS